MHFNVALLKYIFYINSIASMCMCYTHFYKCYFLKIDERNFNICAGILEFQMNILFVKK